VKPKIGEGDTIQRPKEKGKSHKYWFTKHHTDN